MSGTGEGMNMIPSPTILNFDSKQKGILTDLNRFLERYFSLENPVKPEIPSVAYCAEQLHLSANYFGSLVKQESGKTAREYIREKLLDEAKFRILHNDKTINEIAYDLGFRYPQHFSRTFKKFVGQSPKKYRNTRLKIQLLYFA